MINILHKSKTTFRLCVSVLLIVIINLYLNMRYVMHVNIDDDLTYFILYSEMSPFEFICNTVADKFRPLYNLLIWLVYTMAGTHYNYVYIINIFINIGIAITIFLICNNISHKIFLPFCSALAYSCSVLAYYQITQVFGLMESLGLLLSILFVWSLYTFIEQKQFKYYNYALLLYFAVCFVHERYIPYIFVLLFTLCIVDCKCNSNRKYYIFGTLGLVAFILALRFIALHKIGFTGTAGTNIMDTLNILTFLKFICHSIGYMFGINYGHPSTSLFSFSDGWNDYRIIDWILTFLPILCVVVLFFLFFISQRNKNFKNNRDFKMLLLFLLCIGINLCSASITIRVELRWIYTPFSIMLIALCFLATHTKFQRGIYFGICMLLCIICFNLSHRQYFSRLYYWPTLTFGEELYKYTIGNHGNNIEDMDIVFIMNENDFANWNDEYLSTFFSQYFEVQHTITRISNINNLAEQIFQSKNFLLLQYNDMTFEEIGIYEIN